MDVRQCVNDPITIEEIDPHTQSYNIWTPAERYCAQKSNQQSRMNERLQM